MRVLNFITAIFAAFTIMLVGFLIGENTRNIILETSYKKVTFLSRTSYSVWDLTGAPPFVPRTWYGTMTSIDEGTDNLIYGSVSVGYVPGLLEFEFSDFFNITQSRKAHGEVPDFSFSDVQVDLDGYFSDTSNGHRIEGAFYGPEQMEIYGTFTYGELFGTFGARQRACVYRSLVPRE